MATSKKTINKGKKIVKKVKKSKHKGLYLLLFLIVLALFGFLGFEYIQEKKNYEDFSAKTSEIAANLSLPNTLDENIALQSEIDGYKITWNSSDENYLSKNGVITRPEYAQGDKNVTLTATFTYQNKTFVYGFIKSFVGDSEKEYKYTIKILAKEATPEEFVDMALAGLYMPSEIDESIGLISSGIKEGLTVEWKSSDESTLSSAGVYNNALESDKTVTMTATVKYQGVQKSESFEVLVLSNSRKKYLIDEGFDELDQNNRYISFENASLNYQSVMIVADPFYNEEEVDETEVNSADNVIKLRSNNDGSAFVETKTLNNIHLFSFNYIFNQGVNEATYLEIYLGEELKEHVALAKNEAFVSYSFDFEGQSGKIKVLFVNNIKTEKVLLIDDFKVEGVLSEDDLDNILTIPSKISKSIVLPKSTQVGGVVTWTSSDVSIISNDGIIDDSVTENKNVSLSASFSYKGITKNYVFEVQIALTSTSLDAVKIYFIDICEEDIGDCGEAILIVYNEIDVLVDAGDQKNSTYNCVKNAINEYSNDQILDYVVATHPDSDHIGNMANVFRDFQVNNLIKFSGESFTTQKFKNLKAAYDSEPNCNVYDIYDDIINDSNKDNDYIYFTDSIYIKFIDTKHYQDSETNGRSIVFLLNVYDTKVLFTGDADNLSPHSNLESSYMNEVGDIDILKVVHHGTANGTSAEYLNVLKPEVAIICNGNYLGNKHGHPHVETIDRLASCAPIKHVYAITGGGLHCEMTTSGAYKGTTTIEESKVDRNGTIFLTIDNNGYSFSAKITLDALIDLRDTTYYKSYLNSK